MKNISNIDLYFIPRGFIINISAMFSLFNFSFTAYSIQIRMDQHNAKGRNFYS